MSLISLKDVSFSYEGRIVLSGVSFELSDGDYLCVVGENGAGKSTLLKGLLGLKKHSGGQILFGDGLSNSEIGCLPQQTQTQRDFPASVWEVVLSGCLNRLSFFPFYRRRERERAEQAMEYLKITGLRKHCYRNLSGGQQQRTLLARALCATSKLLILDEPVSGLDPRAQLELYELVRELNRKLHITIIMVSHDVRQALPYANKVLHLAHKQLFFGGREEYLETELGKGFLKGGEQ